MTFYDAFAGIGGFRLGLESAGHRCIGSCEINEYARKVYYKRFGEWPDKDIREVKDIKGADMLCGGFPCQDISTAGKGAGLSGERSGLWWELARIIKDCVPRWVFLENVPALLGRGLGDILGHLASCGYDAEWDCLSAQAFGAPHRRDRIWIVAYSNSDRLWLQSGRSSRANGKDQTIITDDGKEKSMANPNGHRLEKNTRNEQLCKSPASGGASRFFTTGSGKGMSLWDGQAPTFTEGCGMVDGIPNRVDRLKCLGNAVVPQVVEWIGKRIELID